MKQINGSEIVIECLKEQGVDTVFGYPGGAILNIYDALYKHQDEITHILTSHEQGASHAADGYARATGKVGVCMATSGPGATNLVTGIATAYMDSTPMVVITANVTVPLLGKDSFQEVDIAGIVMPVVKHSYIVKDVKELAKTIRRAFQIAQEGRPGPVLIDIAKDVTAAEYEYKPKAPAKIAVENDEIKEADLEAAIRLIGKAKKPYIFIGGGAVISGADKEIADFVDKVNAPVADTLMGKGAFNSNDPRYTGMVGMHGTKVSNLGITACDLLIVIGGRLNDRVCTNPKKFAKKAKILQIDIDPAEINKNIKTYSNIIGDIKIVLAELNKRLEKHEHQEWLDHIMELKEKYPLTYHTDRLSGPQIIEKIDELAADDTIITTEVGQHQMWASQFYHYIKPRTFITSGGLGTMGFGLGASLGAKMGCPERTVVNIAGDGCFRMNMNEMATASRYNIPIIQVVLNNHVLGMVRQWQTLFYGERYSHTTLNDGVDFVKVAEAMGVAARRVENIAEFEAAFTEALASKAPMLIDCYIDSDDKVWPMVSPGASIEDAFNEEDLLKNS